MKYNTKRHTFVTPAARRGLVSDACVKHVLCCSRSPYGCAQNTIYPPHEAGGRGSPVLIRADIAGAAIRTTSGYIYGKRTETVCAPGGNDPEKLKVSALERGSVGTLSLSRKRETCIFHVLERASVRAEEFSRGKNAYGFFSRRRDNWTLCW